MAQLVRVLSHTSKAVGLIPHQSTYLVCGFDPSWDVYVRKWVDVSLSLSLPLSLKSIHIFVSEDFLKVYGFCFVHRAAVSL